MLRVCIVASSFQGIVPSSGIGTFYTALAEALVAAGHSVTLLYTQGNISHSVEGDFAFWRQRYLEKGIEMVPLQRLQVEGVLHHAMIAWSVYRWLQPRSHMFDVVHVHDYQGHGYYTVVAKHLRIAFATTTIVVMTHGPLRWARTANSQQLDSLLDAEVDFLEQQTVRLADIVLSPSQYMLQWIQVQGWLPRKEAEVMPLLVPSEARKLLEELAATAQASDLTGRRRVEELVFFGRLEGRKGIVEFCDSVDAMIQQRPGRLTRAAFLGGTASTILGRPSREYLEPRMQTWRERGVEVDILDDKDTRGALTYLLGGGGGRCAVLPSRSENSPMVVTELLAAKVPFLASNVGGIPELVAPASHAATLFQARNGTALTDAISRALEQGVEVSHAARALGSLESSWLDWHRQHARRCEPRAKGTRGAALRGSPPVHAKSSRPESTVMAIILHSTQRAADTKGTFLSLSDQDPAVLTNICLVLVGTVTEDSERMAQSLSGLEEKPRTKVVRSMRRSDGILQCSSERSSPLVLLLEAGSVMKAGAVGLLAARLLESGLVEGDGGITAAAHPFGNSVHFDACSTSREVRGMLANHSSITRLFLGPAIRSGMFSNVFGGDAALLSAQLVEELASQRQLGEVRGFWEMLAAAAVRGSEVQAIPEPLYWMRSVRAPPRSVGDLKRLLRVMPHNFTDEQLQEIIKGTTLGVATVMGAPELPMAIVQY